jgi:hypothetical protein
LLHTRSRHTAGRLAATMHFAIIKAAWGVGGGLLDYTWCRYITKSVYTVPGSDRQRNK